MEGPTAVESAENGPPSRVWIISTVLAGLVGWGLVLGCAGQGSATYDEVTYLRVASEWWRTGRQESITRMGSPLTFWKLQQAPSLWMLQHVGAGQILDDPDEYGAALLPRLRAGASWIWLCAFALTAGWARWLQGPKAMALAAWLFALSPNLIAHGALLTMEMPFLAAATGSGFLFAVFLRTGRRPAFLGSAAVAGLAFSCKFTAVLIPPLCGLAWWVERWPRGERSPLRPMLGMLGYVAVMLAADLVVTGFATLPPSERVGDHPSLGRGTLAARLSEVPLPADWVGFATQMRHQRSGGPSYLLGHRAMTGWWYYYFVAMAAKCPPVLWLMVAARLATLRRRDVLLLLVIGAFLVVTAAGSSRNYGVRYVLPVAPLAIIWLSGLAEIGPAWRGIGWAGVVGYGVAVATTHPHELAYFPAIVGGPEGGRRILADSNLDWGQGLRDLAKLQREHPEYRDLTLYYFGLARPGTYGVAGRCIMVDASDRHPDLPPRLAVDSGFLAVSASLQYGPWGPPGYFSALDAVRPRALLPDASIAVYAADDLPRSQ